MGGKSRPTETPLSRKADLNSDDGRTVCIIKKLVLDGRTSNPIDLTPAIIFSRSSTVLFNTHSSDSLSFKAAAPPHFTSAFTEPVL